MKSIFFLLLLFLLPLQTTHAKLHVTYHQSEAQIAKIQNDGTILSEKGSKFKQANSQSMSIDLDLNQTVYIKYFVLLNENYYVAIKNTINGPFDLSTATNISSTHAAK